MASTRWAAGPPVLHQSNPALDLVLEVPLTSAALPGRRKAGSRSPDGREGAGGQVELTPITTWHSRDAEFKEEGETIMPPPCKGR